MALLANTFRVGRRVLYKPGMGGSRIRYIFTAVTGNATKLPVCGSKKIFIDTVLLAAR